MVMLHAARTLNASSQAWVSAIEHPCVLRATASHFPQRHRLIPVTRAGVIDVDWLKEHLKRERPGLVAVMAANNETGVLQPWDEVLKLCREREVPFFCDAAQWLGRLPAKGLGQCDFVSGCAHKFGGPKGSALSTTCPGFCSAPVTTPKAAQPRVVVLILLKLSVVSPHPPSTFTFAASQSSPREASAADLTEPVWPCRSAIVSAHTAVAVERALLESSPVQ